MGIGKLLLEYLCVSSCSNSCFCMNYNLESKEDDYFEEKPLITSQSALRLKDVVAGNHTLAFQLKPRMVVLKVSMHCNGCARKVEKHISKLDGVTSYKVDLESKMVVVIGDIFPLEVLESVCKVMKNAQIWDSPPSSSVL
ncbi:heavy metal transport/detoxification superfamily protein [Tripterygium wilfordii]|uniref:Heavy metal transport/detoxification superfamily protein n=1 Tax=Tripterygium wilfordii TaxID=458696 RepID=A0A7J7DQL0_TRIWF|nr:heavy metal-associated isoprenylated plant protein 45 [Tripterygium wilfordii]XP_038699271.1 heavy metal-associated isoprenylated plant protein 45 [Tripterygium wilfordii]XP_038699272.1 heavy metal-associated isoprenylated plant protein 45 [Tripterygium wilfordii]XP_038699273.1 heavy metal-associated isoprenylated plant protein 45 [Tripterygium wilfordii]KAF5748611.1 heavy metal transport/detoxification superfamily protein [Tripterygium wilfordii]